MNTIQYSIINDTINALILTISSEDGLFCVKDYKKYLSSHQMDVSRAEECFNFMLNVRNLYNQQKHCLHFTFFYPLHRKKTLQMVMRWLLIDSRILFMTFGFQLIPRGKWKKLHLSSHLIFFTLDYEIYFYLSF